MRRMKLPERGGCRRAIGRVDRDAFGAHRSDETVDSLSASVEKNLRPLRSGKGQLGRDQL